MISIRFHGRGGQGAVTAAALVALAAYHQGQQVQAFPFFGVERQGAPVEAYCRIAEEKITIRSQIKHPDFLIIQDASLLNNPNTFKGVMAGAKILINSEKPLEQLKIPAGLIATVIPATKIALECLGKPFINTALLGAFAGDTKIIKLAALKKAIREEFAVKDKEVIAGNIQAAALAYQLTNRPAKPARGQNKNGAKVGSK